LRELSKTVFVDAVETWANSLGWPIPGDRREVEYEASIPEMGRFDVIDPPFDRKSDSTAV